MRRMKWMEMLLQRIQMESCKTHQAEINYRHVLIRSIVGGVVLAVIIITRMQRKNKKVKEM